MELIERKIRELASQYAEQLRAKVDAREAEMASDDRSHYLIYQVLGITDVEGERIDLYQNMGRFLYKYAGSFLEEAVILCFQQRFSDAKAKVRIPNTMGQRPKTFEIDCLVQNEAFEIKWRDATTDGDHITKEHTRAKVVRTTGYIPIRVMFYYPNRQQAIRIQDTLKTIYDGLGGKYYSGDSAWHYVKVKTGVDLKEVLTKIAEDNAKTSSL